MFIYIFITFLVGCGIVKFYGVVTILQHFHTNIYIFSNYKYNNVYMFLGAYKCNLLNIKCIILFLQYKFYFMKSL